MDGLGGAVERYNSSPAPEETAEPQTEKSETGSEGGKGHTFHVRKHKNGKHHLTVMGENGQLVHHSEHESLEEAAEEMKAHGDESHID